MDLLIFFSIVFATIIFAIILERIIHCPVLVGFAFFAIFLIVAAVLNNTTYIIISIALGILAFIVAFLDCVFRNSNFFRNNGCLRCNNDDTDNSNCTNNTDDTLTILNSNGRVVARINGNSVTCNDNNNCSCGCSNNNLGISLVSNNGNILNNSENNCSSCGCSNRSYGMRRY